MTNHDWSFRFVRTLLLGFLLFAWCVASAPAHSDKRQLTLEWIFGPEGRSVRIVPATSWLDDGTLVILENRRSARESTFEKLDPTNGQRQSILDSARALADLKSAAGVDADVVPWPIAFDGSGKRALYILKG